MQTNTICFQSLAGHANVWRPGFITSPWSYTSCRMIQADMHMCMWCSGKESPANVGYSRDLGSISGSGKSLGVGNGNPLQYPCLENSMDRGVWLAIVHRVTKSQTHLSRSHFHLQEPFSTQGLNSVFCVANGFSFYRWAIREAQEMNTLTKITRTLENILFAIGWGEMWF